MADGVEHKEGQGEEEQLTDSFFLSWVIGALIVAMWLWVFIVYVDRL